ncbi:hypothetical protein BJY01DRAFT_254417 [Aspergillus pseudoustus]|uniref:Rhodopsin domain-containing protein n=1 Tax=Aspergillus pseudoustus TaxID=1810923 RepID=A0ABR4IVZ6_9EURO
MAYNTTACVAAAITLYVLSCISLILRVYARLFLLKKFAADDYLAIIATVTNSVLVISYVLGVLCCGLGSYISRESSQPGLKIIIIGELFYIMTTYLAKLSFTFTLHNIVMERPHMYILYLLIAMGTVISVFAWFWILFFCNPVQFFWEQVAASSERPIHGSCKSNASLAAVFAVHASWVLLTDITLGLILPVLILWNIQMHRKMKASVYLLLGIGLVSINICLFFNHRASIATIIRLNYLPYKRVSEPLISHHRLIIWSVVEAAISIICTATVAIKPLIVHLGLLSASQSSATAGSSQSDAYTRKRGASRSARAHTGNGGKAQLLEISSDRWYMMEPVDPCAHQDDVVISPENSVP